MEFLNNTDVVVGVGFVIFLGVLVYFGAPRMILGKLDERAVRIKADLEEARALREEAQGLLAAFERKQKEAQGQVDDIVASARADAEKAAEQAKEDIRRSMARRLQTATDQIAAAEKAAIRQVRDRAVGVAIAAAADVIRQEMKAGDANALIDAAIAEVGAKMH